jgi:hypothetical protein
MNGKFIYRTERPMQRSITYAFLPFADAVKTFSHKNEENSRMISLRKVLQISFCLCVLFAWKSEAHNYGDIPDFEFDDYFVSDSSNKHESTKKQIDNYDEFFVPDRSRLSSREKNFKYEILRILTSTELKHKFLEVLPLLRRLTKQQRIVLSSIIFAQMDGLKSVSFNEVSAFS